MTDLEYRAVHALQLASDLNIGYLGDIDCSHTKAYTLMEPQLGELKGVSAAQLECDGAPIELPEDIEGILLLNLNSYMGGVDLWASGAADPRRPSGNFAPQSYCDGILEVRLVIEQHNKDKIKS